MRSFLVRSNSLCALSDYFKYGSIITPPLEALSDQIAILDATDAQAENRVHGRFGDIVGDLPRNF